MVAEYSLVSGLHNTTRARALHHPEVSLWVHAKPGYGPRQSGSKPFQKPVGAVPQSHLEAVRRSVIPVGLLALTVTILGTSPPDALTYVKPKESPAGAGLVTEKVNCGHRRRYLTVTQVCDARWLISLDTLSGR